MQLPHTTAFILYQILPRYYLVNHTRRHKSSKQPSKALYTVTCKDSWYGVSWFNSVVLALST